MQKYQVTFFGGKEAVTQIFQADNLVHLLDKIVSETPYYMNDITNLQKIF